MNLRNFMERITSSFAGRVLGNSSWGVASNIVTILTGLLQIGLVTRALGVEQYGILAVIVAFPTMIQQFAGFRTWEMVARYSAASLHADRGDEAGHIAQLGWLIDSLIGFVSFVAVWIAGAAYLQATLASTSYLPLLHFYSFAVLIMVPVSTAQALLRVLDQFHLLFIQSIIANLLRLTFVTIAYFSGTGLVGILTAYLAASVANAVTSLVFCLWKARGHVIFTHWFSAWTYVRMNRRNLSSFLSAGYVEASILAFARNLDIMLVANMGGAEQAGYYRAAQSLVTMFAGFLTPMVNAVLPDLQRSISLPADVLRRRLWSLTAMSSSIYIPGALVLTLLAPWLVIVIMGPTFAPAAAPAQIMLWGTALAGTFFWVPALLLVQDRQWVRTGVLMAAVVCQFVFLYLLVPMFGAIGAAIAYLSLHTVFNFGLLLSLIRRGAPSQRLRSGSHTQVG